MCHNRFTKCQLFEISATKCVPVACHGLILQDGATTSPIIFIWVPDPKTELKNKLTNGIQHLFKKNNIKISTICNLSAIDNLVSNGDLITLQLNEGVVYMGQIEDDEDALDKYKYV